MKIIRLAILISLAVCCLLCQGCLPLLLGGVAYKCLSNKNINGLGDVKKYWEPSPYVHLLKPLPSFKPDSQVLGRNLGIFASMSEFNKKMMSPEALRKRKAEIKADPNTILGIWTVTCTLLCPLDIREIVARLGGDFYDYYGVFGGVATGTRMIPVGYTTPHIVSTSSQASGVGNYYGTYNNIYGGTANAYGTASGNGYASSQTLIGGSTTYAAQTYKYEVVTQTLIVYATPQRVEQLIKAGIFPSALQRPKDSASLR